MLISACTLSGHVLCGCHMKAETWSGFFHLSDSVDFASLKLTPVFEKYQ